MSDLCQYCETPIDDVGEPCCDGKALEIAIAEVERLTVSVERLAPSPEYSANLQRMIQRHCRGKTIESPLYDTSPFLAGLLNGCLQEVTT